MILTRLDILFVVVFIFLGEGIFFLWLSDKMLWQNNKYYERLREFIDGQEQRYLVFMAEFKCIKKDIELLKAEKLKKVKKVKD